MDIHGDAGSVTLTPSGGVGTAYDAILEKEVNQEDPELAGIVVKHTRTVLVRQEDVTPSENWTATVGGMEYSVVQVIDANDGFWELKLERTGAQEISRPQYRGQR